MKRLILLFLLLIALKINLFSQNPNVPSAQVIYTGSNDAVYYDDGTFYVNSSVYFLSKYFNFDATEESLEAMSDTTIVLDTIVNVVDTTTNTILKTLKQKVSFKWKKSIAIPPGFIDPPTTSYKTTSGRWDDCTYYIYVFGISHVCYALMICDLPNDDTYTWCSGAVYTKIFEDNFEGNQLNEDYWSYGYGYGREVNASDISWALNKNVEVSNGTVKLKAKYEPGPVTDSDMNIYANKTFTSGAICSNFKYGYGKYEMRAKVPASVGVNPAYWLLGPNLEIDGFEFFYMNRADAPSMTIYSNNNTNLTGGPCFGYDGKSQIFSQTAHKNVWSNLPDLSQAFYHYTFVYDPNYITFWIESDDYQLSWRLTVFNVQQQGISNVDPNANCSCTGCVVQVNANFPYAHGGNNFIINNTPSGSKDFTSGQPNQQGPYPGSTSIMEIDWVKIYVPDDCWHDVTEGSGMFRAVDHLERNYITGNTVTLGGSGNYTVHFAYYDPNNPNGTSPQTHCAARANNELALLDGFSVEENALFEGSISYHIGDNGSGVASDCNNLNYWSQIYRSANTEEEEEIKTGALKSADGIHLFPNPSYDFITLQSERDIRKVEIYNTLGQLVYTTTVMNQRIDIHELKDDIYIVKAYTDDKPALIKFVKTTN